MRETASRGFYAGGPRPYGYRRLRVQDGSVQRVKVEPDPDTASEVELVQNGLENGNMVIERTLDGLTPAELK